MSTDRKADEDLKIRRGREAAQLLKEGLLREVLDEISGRMASAWAESLYDAKDEREECYRMLRAVRAIEEGLQGVADEGKIAQHERDTRERE